MKVQNARYVNYDELLENSYQAYPIIFGKRRW